MRSSYIVAESNAFANAFLGMNHSLAHKIGGVFHTPHGRANAILLPYVIKYNASRPTKFVSFPKYEFYIAAQKYAILAKRLDLKAETTEERAKIREQLILGNMRLVTYFAWFYSQIFSIDIDELEEYGYEGLIYAIDNYDINSTMSFYSYTKIYIKRFINKGIYNIIGVKFNVNYCPYFLYKKPACE
mgnify:CR=1 FL=1